MSVQFQCNLAESTGPFPHFWEHTVGSGHAPLVLRADMQQQLKQCHQELGFQHVRFHGLLSDDMGTLVDEDNKLLFSFFNADQIMDFLLSIGMKPFVELSFMPRAIASGDTTVFNYHANVTPPRDFKQWSTLIRRLITHWVERYGIDELRTWFFEVWNEPNEKGFWTATQADYFRLYQTTVRTIKEIDAELKVGGPVTAKNEWVPEFLEFCRENHLPADFVSTHQYPTDAFGTASEDTISQLAASRRGILRQWAQDVHRQADGHPLYYTEWNASSNPRDPLHDEPYTAAFVAKTVMEAQGLMKGYSFWTFSDIFEENYFPTRAFQGGFGLLNLQGISKPVYRAFELLHRLGDQQRLVDGIHETALPRHPIDTQAVHIKLTSAGRPAAVTIDRIDEDHANPRRLWHEMGEPPIPTPAETEKLRASSEIPRFPLPYKLDDHTVEMDLTLPPLAVAAITLEGVFNSDSGGSPS